MREVILFIIVFLIIYLSYLFFIILRKKKLERFKNNTYVKYLVKVNKLNEDKLNIKFIAHIIAITNAFIIATTFIIVELINNFLLMMVVAFLILIPLQFIMYSIIGWYLKRREENV